MWIRIHKGPEYGSNLEPDSDPQHKIFVVKIHESLNGEFMSSFVHRWPVWIHIHRGPEYGSNLDPDPDPQYWNFVLKIKEDVWVDFFGESERGLKPVLLNWKFKP